jgi:amino-acid N-acetyltransferase
MPSPTRARRAGEPFGEKEFYLEEFRGRSVLVAIAPAAAVARFALGPLASALADLVHNDTRVLCWWPAIGAAPERRLRAALGRALGRRGVRAGASVPRVDAASEDLRAVLWGTLRREKLCVLVTDGEAAVDFPGAVVRLATVLHIPKLVLLEPAGGLHAPAERRLSFVDANVLDTLLRQGQAEWTGLGDRRPLLVAVRDALAGGVEWVNVCTPEGVADELFTYEGSGTLFTREDYCHVGPLGLDEFAQAERLLERGQREGVLKLRTPEEVARVLAAGFGATICGRHLAGVAGLVTAPYAAERAGEIVGLYTITRFKGEGIGERLVDRLVAEAGERGLAYVFACAVDERAMQFFSRLGFTRVGLGDVPAAKWNGYALRRRARVAVFKRSLAVPTALSGT